MRYTPFFLPLLVAIPVAAQNSGPFIQGSIYAVQAASRRQALSAEVGFAPGSLCDINTRGLYSPNGQIADGEKITLRFRASGAASLSDLAVVTQASAFDFTVQIPADAPLGQAEIVAIAESGKVFPASVWIAASGFGIFTKLRQGYDAAAAQVWRDGPRTVGLTTPVRAGEWVTLWGTGLGNAKPLVDVAGIAVTPAYAGSAPGLTGVDQINFQFPSGVPDDCYVPLAVTVDGRALQTTSIATASDAGPCRHRLGLPPASMAALDDGRAVSLSQTWVHSDVLPSPEFDGTYRRYDTASLDFMQSDAARIQSITGLLTAPLEGCRLNSDSIAGGIFNFANTPPLDAGQPTLNGPDGAKVAMEGFFGHFYTTPPDVTYPLDKIPASSFGSGEWAVSVPGGRDVAPFRAGLRIPPPLKWLNRAEVSPVSRAKDLVLKWDGTGYSDQEWMQGSIGAGASYIACQSPAAAGSITIPAGILSQLPVFKGAAALVQLLLTPLRDNPALYPVPLLDGSSIPGVATFSYLEAVAVNLQ